jgi:hypothetical protein
MVLEYPGHFGTACLLFITLEVPTFGGWPGVMAT